MSKELLSPADIDRLYGLKKTRFYELLNSGALRAVKVGSSTFVRREDAEEWARTLPAYNKSKKK
jgi:excisionase family DNA binding protein